MRMVVAAATVAIVHGAKVAQWRRLLLIMMVLYYIGLIFGSFTLNNFYLQIFQRALSFTTTSARSLSLILSSALAVLGSMVMSLMITIYWRFSVPGTVSLVASFYLAFTVATGGLSLNGDPGWRLLFVGVCFAGGVSVFLTALVYRYLNDRVLDQNDDPLGRSVAHLPYSFAGVVAVHMATIVWLTLGGLTVLQGPYRFLIALGTLLITFLIAFQAARLFIVNRTKRHVFARFPQQYQEYSMMAAAVEERRLTERGMVPETPPRPESPTPTRQSRDTKYSGGDRSATTLNRNRAEESFVYLLLALTATNALIQGVVDGGTTGGIIQLVINTINGVPLESAPRWQGWWLILLIEGIALFLGHWSSRRLAHDITAIGPVMALAIELGTLLPILITVSLGIPLSVVIVKLSALLMAGRLSGRDVNYSAAIRYALVGVASVVLTAALSTLMAFLGTFFEIQF